MQRLSKWLNARKKIRLLVSEQIDYVYKRARRAFESGRRALLIFLRCIPVAPLKKTDEF